jgi:hypothetical protein
MWNGGTEFMTLTHQEITIFNAPRSRAMRFTACVLCGVLLGCSTEHRGDRARQGHSPPLYLFWGAEDGHSAYRFLSARIHLDQPFCVGGNNFMNLTGRVEGRGTNLIADLEGSTGQQSQVYRGSMMLEKPFYAQGGAASGGAGPRYWFLLTTNWDCRSVLERVNAVAGLTGPPFYHPAPNAPLPAPKAATNIDPATGLPWGNRAVDPITGLPLSQDHDKK